MGECGRKSVKIRKGMNVSYLSFNTRQSGIKGSKAGNTSSERQRKRWILDWTLKDGADRHGKDTEGCAAGASMAEARQQERLRTRAEKSRARTHILLYVKE